MDHSRKIGKATRKEKEEYKRRVRESHGFDMEGVIIPGDATVVPRHFNHCNNSTKILVKLYAKMGLHRFNMLLGGNFELLDIKKVNMKRIIPSTFYITLDAIDAATGINKVFHVKVFETRIRYFLLRCTIARPKVASIISENEHPFLKVGDQSFFSFYKGSSVSDFYKGSLPQWPSSEEAFNDTKRFYVLKKSELQNNSWIHLYLELALARKSRTINEDDLSHLEVVKVVIETEEAVERPKDRLNSKWAIFYIRFQNLAKAEIGEAKDCLAIVRRVFNETTGDLMLEGNTASCENGFNAD